MVIKPSFGITFLPPFPPETLVSYAQSAEAAGFDILWLYEDSFYGGAFTSAATILAATNTIQVGIGLLPVTVRNPLFVAMEISTLARLYPNRFIPGFGHGFEPWIRQIGAYPKSPLLALEETVTAVRSLLSGQETSLQGSHVHLDRARLLLPPNQVPPLYVGGVREKTLRLAGRIADGTLLSVPSSPAYVRWANRHIDAGAAEGSRSQNVRAVWTASKVNPDAAAAREPVRRWLAECIQAGLPHLIPMGIDEEARALFQKYGLIEGAKQMPDAWVDALSSSGTPEHAVRTIQQLIDAGADLVILAPVENTPESLSDTIRYLMPVIRSNWPA